MRTEKLSILALGFCGITALVGCGDQNSGANAPASASEESSGEVNLALQLANGATLNSASYTIVGPNALHQDRQHRPDLGDQAERHHRWHPRRHRLHDHHHRHHHRQLDDLRRLRHVQRDGAHDRARHRRADLSRGAAHRQRDGLRRAERVPDDRRASAQTRARSSVGGTIALVGGRARQRRRPERAVVRLDDQRRHAQQRDRARTPRSPARRRAPRPSRLSVSDGDPAASCADTQTAQVTCSVAPKAPGHVRRRRLPQPHHLLGRLDLDAEAGQEGDRQDRDALGSRLVRAGRPRRQRQPQLHAGRRRDAGHARLSVHRGQGPDHHLGELWRDAEGRRLPAPARTRTCGAGSRFRSSSTRSSST